jgi:hypothetical protein
MAASAATLSAQRFALDIFDNLKLSILELAGGIMRTQR